MEARHRAGALSLEHAGARGAAADGEEASQNAATLEPWQLYAAAVPAAQSVSAPKPSHQCLQQERENLAAEARHRARALSLESVGAREAAADGKKAAQCRHTCALAALGIPMLQLRLRPNISLGAEPEAKSPARKIARFRGRGAAQGWSTEPGACRGAESRGRWQRGGAMPPHSRPGSSMQQPRLRPNQSRRRSQVTSA